MLREGRGGGREIKGGIRAGEKGWQEEEIEKRKAVSKIKAQDDGEEREGSGGGASGGGNHE